MTYLCPIFIDLSFLGQDCWRIFIICLLYVPCPYSFSETNEKYVTYVGISYYNELFLQRMVKKKLFSKNADSYLDAFIVDAQKKMPNFCWKICDEAENDTCCDKVGKKWNLILLSCLPQRACESDSEPKLLLLY